MSLSMVPRLAAGACAALLLGTSVSAYTLLDPPRKWFSTPRQVNVDDGGLTSVGSPDPDGGLSAALRAVAAWNTCPGGPVLSVTSGAATSATLALGDGRSNIVFADPLGVCIGSCIAATMTGYYDLSQAGTCGTLNVVRITDADVVFNTRHAFTTEAEDPAGSGTCSSEIYLEAVTSHEVGHLIGLGHSTHSAALMAPTIAYCNDKPFNADDTAGRNGLYDCSAGGGCLAVGRTCVDANDCCSGSCRGKPGKKTCR